MKRKKLLHINQIRTEKLRNLVLSILSYRSLSPSRIQTCLATERTIPIPKRSCALLCWLKFNLHGGRISRGILFSDYFAPDKLGEAGTGRVYATAFSVFLKIWGLTSSGVSHAERGSRYL